MVLHVALGRERSERVCVCVFLSDEKGLAELTYAHTDSVRSVTSVSVLARLAVLYNLHSGSTTAAAARIYLYIITSCIHRYM